MNIIIEPDAQMPQTSGTLFTVISAMQCWQAFHPGHLPGIPWKLVSYPGFHLKHRDAGGRHCEK